MSTETVHIDLSSTPSPPPTPPNLTAVGSSFVESTLSQDTPPTPQYHQTHSGIVRPEMAVWPKRVYRWKGDEDNRLEVDLKSGDKAPTGEKLPMRDVVEESGMSFENDEDDLARTEVGATHL
ncbi:hypothetical protein Clacol_004603 [Clathrus columnatus]|uniref:Uncharacterized protein n=1 Tax=Clathrus columnatus TaxID=1419009 RepID=A0AAV5A9X7_9AGAM|nr:hypothetical protein Clacol_004603 [Clathrus columnatus]